MPLKVLLAGSQALIKASFMRPNCWHKRLLRQEAEARAPRLVRWSSEPHSLGIHIHLSDVVPLGISTAKFYTIE